MLARRPWWREQLSGLETRPSDRVAAWLTRRLGAMGTVYATIVLSALWMVLGARQVLGYDPFPYPLLLLVGNIVQLLLGFVILAGQRILGEAVELRAEQTYEDTEAILAECHRLQEQIDRQNLSLNRAVADGATLDRCDTAPIRITPPHALPRPETTLNRRIAARLVRGAGSTNAFYGATAVVGGWMLLAQLGLIDDPYPFPFLVFLSSLAQLVFMFLIMVGQDVLGEESDRRAIQTGDHTAVVLQQCRHLRAHLAEQDDVLEDLVARVPEADPLTPSPRGHDELAEPRARPER